MHAWWIVGGALVGYLVPSRVFGGAPPVPSSSCEEYAATLASANRSTAALVGGTAFVAGVSRLVVEDERARAFLLGMTGGAIGAAALHGLAGGVVANAGYAVCKARELQATPVTETGTRWIGDPIVVEEGKRYRVRVDLSGPVSWVASKEKVKAYAEGRGFRDVNVWTGEDRVPSGWPPEVFGGELDEDVYFVEGTATRAQRIARPSQVRFAWEVR